MVTSIWVQKEGLRGQNCSTAGRVFVVRTVTILSIQYGPKLAVVIPEYC